MLLADLIASLGPVPAHGDLDTEVTGVTADSRSVRPGHLFVAVRGARTDGHDFIPDAVRRGAVAVVGERNFLAPPGVAKLLVPDGRWALSALADAYHGHPGRLMQLVGITGTNGKTTVAFLVKQLGEAMGVSAGVLGTAGNVLGDRVVESKSGYTTPEATTVHRLLRQMHDGGARVVAMEVTSHALDQQRVAHCAFTVAVFTNLTWEHLDYHRDMEAYYQAKARLFRGLQAGATAVMNLDDAYGRRLLQELPTGVRAITYSLSDAGATLRAADIQLAGAGVAFRLHGPGGALDVTAPRLFGRYNVENALAAVGSGLALGWDPAVMAAALARVQPAPGRFEPVNRGQDFQVIVDYAHTPDGFEKLLRDVTAVRRQAGRGRVIMVFGSAGHRDQEKRPEMGRIAGRYCDLLVLTEEDPRSESAVEIMRQIAAGVDRPECRTVLIEDRVAAIEHAVQQARSGDFVLITGKGNETELEVQHATTWRGDVPAAAAALERRLAARKAAGEP